MGKSKIVGFDIPALALKRNDDLEIQYRIMAMTPDERKRLGISKSGLWYQKKKIAEGTRMKVYKKVLEKIAERTGRP